MGIALHCQKCSKVFKPRRSGVKNKYCSRTCYWETMKGKPAANKGASYPQLRGKNNHNWKEIVTYSGVHRWLYRNYGKADHCEHCGGDAIKYEWALVSGKSYEKVRGNFTQLCTSCHHKYDDSRNKMWLTRRG